jgi:hypothetical protein
MDPLQVPEGFPISGVAPEASIYAYRIFSCKDIGQPGRGGTSDLVIKAMMKAFEDKVDIISMSLSLQEGQVTPVPKVNPIASIARKIYDAGIAIAVAMGNTGSNQSPLIDNLYTQTLPSELSTVIAVGSLANSRFPLVYNAKDSAGATLHYASVHPLALSTPLEVYVMQGDACQDEPWDEAIAFIEANGDLQNTVLAFTVTDLCRPSAVQCCRPKAPGYILGIYAETNNPYFVDLETPLPYRFNNGSTKAYTMDQKDAATLVANYQAAGGFKKYQLTFNDPVYSSPPQRAGGQSDVYTSFGPVQHTYEMKPQLSAPGGHILATFPTPFGGYGIISGTSMATPYVSGCYALVKSQFPGYTVKQILDMLQTTANPVLWPHDQTLLATPAMQGAGMVNAYDAIKLTSRASPGQLLVSDNNRTTYGQVEITIENKGSSPETYTLGHRGAGYTNQGSSRVENSQLPKYGSAKFPTTTFELAPGTSTQIAVSITPPDGVETDRHPVFGGYIDIIPSTGANLSIPYIGPPYSLFNTDYIKYQETTDGDSGTPNIYTTSSGGERVYNLGYAEISPSVTYGSIIIRRQWTTRWRVDIVPADTKLSAHHFGPNRTIPADYVYKPGTKPPTSTLFGQPSYGYLSSFSGLIGVGDANSPQGTGFFTVTDDSGAKVTLGPGDYKWYVSVLRWGGDQTVQNDYDSWLGPIIRLVE